MKNFFKNNSKTLLSVLIIFALPTITYADQDFFSNMKDILSSPTISSPSFGGKLLQILLLISIVGIAPTILFSVTSFIRIVIVLSITRTALGLQQSPPNQVINAIALFLTFFIMQPVFEKSYTEGIRPMLSGELSEEKAIHLVIEPFKKFMAENTRTKDVELFYSIAKIEQKQNVQDVPLHVLLPAFMISELHKAFAIGFLIFLPFLVIDIVVSSILMAMGMIMLPPVMITLPIKLIFFVLIDGWYLLSSSLVKSFMR